MDQAKAIINIKEGLVELEGPVGFVERYLERYAPAAKVSPFSQPETAAPAESDTEIPKRARGSQRSCTRAIRAEVKAGFFDQPRSTRLVRERLSEKGAACSIAVLRSSLRRAVKEGRLETTGRARGLVYSRKAQEGSVKQPVEPMERESQSL